MKRGPIRLAWQALLVTVSVAAFDPAVAATRRECRQACADEITSCVAGGERLGRCRRLLIHQCRQEGIAVCLSPGESPADARAARLSLSAPGSASATATSATTIAVTWLDTNSIEDGYSVEQSLSATTGFAVVGTTGANGVVYAVNGLATGQTYYYRVRAWRRKGGGRTYSPYSQVVFATTNPPADTTPPLPPSSLTATATDCTQVSLGWAASSDLGADTEDLLSELGYDELEARRLAAEGAFGEE